LGNEKVLVIGLGEIGRTLFEILNKSKSFDVYGLDINATRMLAIEQDQNMIPSKVDIIHICIPFKNQEKFLKIVNLYATNYKPNLLIINSTVIPGTTQKVYEQYKCLVAHSPVRGVHENLNHMIWEMQRWLKYVGGVDSKSTDSTCRHFIKAGLRVKQFKSSKESELAKLFETTYRAWMIACFQEMHRISRTFEADFDNLIDFLEDTHLIRLDRPIMFPDFIAGHCLIPNTELLLNAYESEFLRLILKSNEKRSFDLKDEITVQEIKKMKKRTKDLQKKIMEKMNG